jgi:hypothetical protein
MLSSAHPEVAAIDEKLKSRGRGQCSIHLSTQRPAATMPVISSRRSTHALPKENPQRRIEGVAAVVAAR